MKIKSDKNRILKIAQFSKIFGSILLFGMIIFAVNGCALFGDKKSKTNDVEIETPKESQEEDLGEYVASYGRSDPKTKKKVDPGQTFLFSDKAKEIYANTER